MMRRALDKVTNKSKQEEEEEDLRQPEGSIRSKRQEEKTRPPLIEGRAEKAK